MVRYQRFGVIEVPLTGGTLVKRGGGEMGGNGKVRQVSDGTGNAFILASVFGRATIYHRTCSIQFLLGGYTSKPMRCHVQVSSSDTE